MLFFILNGLIRDMGSCQYKNRSEFLENACWFSSSIFIHVWHIYWKTPVAPLTSRIISQLLTAVWNIQPKVTFPSSANKPAGDGKSGLNGLSSTRQVGWLRRRRQSVSAFRRWLEWNGTWTQIMWSAFQRGGRVGAWVGEGRADKTNPKKLLAAE